MLAYCGQPRNCDAIVWKALASIETWLILATEWHMDTVPVQLMYFRGTMTQVLPHSRHEALALPRVVSETGQNSLEVSTRP